MTTAYSLSRKQGWRRFTDTPARTRPERMSPTALTRLAPLERAHYNDSRHDWHANFGTIATPQLKQVREELELIVASNRQDSDRVRGAAVIDGFPGLGKTTMANLFARDYDRTARQLGGETTEAGDERIPVFRVGLTSNTTLRTLNKMICEFYGHPGAANGTAAQLATFALDCVLKCETRIGIIDDVHFINQNSKDGLAVSNHLKWLANELPVTFIYAGVGLTERRFFDEGLSGESTALAQTAARWTRLEVASFDRDDSWTGLIKAIEKQLILAKARPGKLVALDDYLFERTGGHIGSLITLVTRGCFKAIANGTESLSRELLETIRIDEAAERSRKRRAAETKKRVRKKEGAGR
ncbi:AAA family ATPase [Kitasatospora sp. NA04385]|uniref:TniB family NTP-binding protein n=1 Tax=Kitasatospora sp. NA04385 TaxID=2742135 RepID=UPI0015918506|nr:TniB family NTP-binding protein [Kitasatospora sp. NA04385]QKW20226.1 AAA family ATPase [Kitasatospora sp. NA04385]